MTFASIVSNPKAYTSYNRKESLRLQETHVSKTTTVDKARKRRTHHKIREPFFFNFLLLNEERQLEFVIGFLGHQLFDAKSRAITFVRRKDVHGPFPRTVGASNSHIPVNSSQRPIELRQVVKLHQILIEWTCVVKLE
jgi:hypothetical protein